MADIELEIPLDDKIIEFKTYIQNSPRSILSARFGDGKSVFLEKFMQATSSEYVYISIYPINYQVAENKDIFEYIKRDILISLLAQGEEYVNNNDFNLLTLIDFYIKNNFGEASGDLADCIPDLNLGLAGIGLNVDFSKLLKGIKKLKSDFDIYKAQFQDKDQLEAFITSFQDVKGGLYELDPISQLICDIVAKIQSSGKQIVLIIEDLDRIDPAHIFRILNVFSAHFDSCYRGGSHPNKFRFDKVILVCDYDNIAKIYHHFYGEETDFQGYISKFSTNDRYRYSLKDQYVKFIAELLDPDIQQYPLLSNVIARLILGFQSAEENISPNLREIALNLKNKSHCIRDELIPVLPEDYRIPSVNAFTKLLDVLRRFGLKFRHIIHMVDALNKEHKLICQQELIELVGVCWFCVDKAVPDKSLIVSDKPIYYVTKEGRFPRQSALNWQLHLEGNVILKVDKVTMPQDGTDWYRSILQVESFFLKYLINYA